MGWLRVATLFARAPSAGGCSGHTFAVMSKLALTATSPPSEMLHTGPPCSAKVARSRSSRTDHRRTLPDLDEPSPLTSVSPRSPNP